MYPGSAPHCELQPHVLPCDPYRVTMFTMVEIGENYEPNIIQSLKVVADSIVLVWLRYCLVSAVASGYFIYAS